MLIFDKEYQFLKSHEKLIIIVLISLVFLFSWNKIVNYLADKAHVEKDIAVQTLQAQKEKDAAIAADQAKLDANYQATVAQVLADNQRYRNQVQALQADLVAQRQADTALPLPQLGNRWATLLNLPQENFTVVPPNNLSVSEQASQATVQQLEEVPVDRQTIQAKDGVIQNDEKQIAACKVDSDGLRLQISGLQTEIKDQDIACKKTIADINWKNRKSKVKTFIAGFVAGFIAKMFVK